MLSINALFYLLFRPIKSSEFFVSSYISLYNLFVIVFVNFFSIDLYQKLKFVRYGNVTNTLYTEVQKHYAASECAKLPNDKNIDVKKYNELLRTANIIFAPVNFLHRLTRYVDTINFQLHFFHILHFVFITTDIVSIPFFSFE